jgi:predicted nucleic acid-binding protein
MKRYALDASALIVHFEARNGTDKVQKILEAADRGEAELFMSAVNVGEVFYTVWKYHGESHARQAVESILKSGVKIVDATLSNVVEAAELKAKYHTAYADSFVAAVGIKKHAAVMTSDPEFRKISDVVKVVWLSNQKKVN